jgi:hypothetical protein
MQGGGGRKDNTRSGTHGGSGAEMSRWRMRLMGANRSPEANGVDFSDWEGKMIAMGSWELLLMESLGSWI